MEVSQVMGESPKKLDGESPSKPWLCLGALLHFCSWLFGEKNMGCHGYITNMIQLGGLGHPTDDQMGVHSRGDKRTRCWHVLIMAHRVFLQISSQTKRR